MHSFDWLIPCIVFYFKNRQIFPSHRDIRVWCVVA
jgi:hypothetical protein